VVTGEELYTLLPQSFPFVMIDTLVESNADKTVTRLTIPPDHLFIENGLFREPGIIENIAQTAAARSGYEAYKSHTKVKTGYIGTIKNLVIHSLPNIHQTIETEVVIKTIIGNITVVEGRISCCEKVIATCEMTIVEM
jgi:3-hydroxymyristoyl/3-hydroxydecanoyl-(acyl carrier protein) dehydratase